MFHRWQANLRILEIESVRSVPYVPVSHSLAERLIGTLRREYLDRMCFWNKWDLEQKLEQLKSGVPPRWHCPLPPRFTCYRGPKQIAPRAQDISSPDDISRDGLHIIRGAVVCGLPRSLNLKGTLEAEVCCKECCTCENKQSRPVAGAASLAVGRKELILNPRWPVERRRRSWFKVLRPCA